MMLEKWSFLDEWCGVMKSLFSSTCTGSSAAVWRWGPDYHPALQFSIVPPRDSESTATERGEQLQTLREGLALFAAVAWIDVEMRISLLKEKGVCSVNEEIRRHKFMMAEMPVFVEIEATRKLCNDPSDDFSWANDDLVALCCQLKEDNSSEAFREAWARIETIFTRLQPLRGLVIPVQIVIGKPEYLNASGIASQRVWDVINNSLRPDQVRWGWFSSRLGRHSTVPRRCRSVFYAAFVVNCINSKNALTSNRTSSAFVKLLTKMGREVQFSALNFCLVRHRDSQNVCRMISKLFCAETSPNVTIESRGVGHACVSLQAKSGVEMNALCSALAVTRSCRSVTFNLSSHDSPSTVKVWMWIAYAFFSTRVRSRSSVKQVIIYNARLDPSILDTMSRILTATNTEQELFAVAKGLESASGTTRDAREYHLHENAVIQVTEEASGRVVSWDSANIFQQGEGGKPRRRCFHRVGGCVDSWNWLVPSPTHQSRNVRPR